jgi:N-acetylmuramoyl-L-alanine amidase
MRDIFDIVLHCTATLQNASVEAIQRYWKEVMKWKDPGYHVIIKVNGALVWLHPIEKPSNGVAGYNKNAIHISYIGGIDRDGKPVDNRTEAQKKAMYELVKMLKGKFPNAEIKGHRDFPGVKKACPSFEVSEWVKQVGL